MISVKEVFDCLSGNSGLVEEFIYNNIDKTKEQYWVLSSSTVEKTNMGMIPRCKNTNGRDLKVFEDRPGILVARNGKAGKMKFLHPDKYTINDHAYILSLKRQFKQDYNIETIEEEEAFLKYFTFRYQHQMYKYSTSNDNATWNKTAFFEFCEISIPDREVYYQVVQKYENGLKNKELIDEMRAMLQHLAEKVLVVDNESDAEQIEIKRLLSYKSRNDSLSEEGIYNRTPATQSERVINVLSGSTKELYFGKVDIDSPQLHTFEGQGLHVISRGKAGKLTFIPEGTYATNTNAFLFFLKPDTFNLINVSNKEEETVYLKFLRIYLQPIFYELSSKSDLGVFPLTEMMESLKIPLFKYDNEMLRVVKRYEDFEKYLEIVEQTEKQLAELLERQLTLVSEFVEAG